MGTEATVENANFTSMLGVRTPDEVRTYKQWLDPNVRAIDLSVARCATLDPNTRRQWGEFARSWMLFRDTDTGWMRAESDFDIARRFEAQLLWWQHRIMASNCALAGPPMVPKPPEAPSGSNTMSEVQATLRTVAIAVGVVGAAFFVHEISK